MPFQFCLCFLSVFFLLLFFLDFWQLCVCASKLIKCKKNHVRAVYYDCVYISIIAFSSFYLLVTCSLTYYACCLPTKTKSINFSGCSLFLLFFLKLIHGLTHTWTHARNFLRLKKRQLYSTPILAHSIIHCTRASVLI